MDENSPESEIQRMLRRLIESGQLDPKVVEQISGIVDKPGALSEMMRNFQVAFSSPQGSVNWDLALNQAITIAKQGEAATSELVINEIPKAFDIAQLWLSEVTNFIENQPLKMLSRSMWVKDAMPLFQELSEPIATSMSRALSENLGDALPEELSQMLGSAKNFLGNAGATIFAMQLGQASGRLASEAILGSEIGIPITSRPGVVPQNLASLLSEIEGSRTEFLIYLATRELALTALFNANPYLRESFVSQVREFAAGLKIDVESIQEIADQVDLSNPEVNHVIEMSSALAARTEEQELALSRIESTLALVEGWVDSVAAQACVRLPMVAAASELYRRRRSSSGVGQKVFATLLGLELTPKLVRECEALWTMVEKEFGTQVRDELISHPDKLPSLGEIQDLDLLRKRLRAEPDDFDQQLRKLLDQ